MGPDPTRRRVLATGAAVAGTAALLGPLGSTAAAAGPAAGGTKPTTRLMQATQRPFSASASSDITTAAAWRDIPGWGLVAGEDKAIPPTLERFFYQRAGARGVVEVPGASHVPMVSRPGTTARLVQVAAETSSPAGGGPPMPRHVIAVSRAIGRPDESSVMSASGQDASQSCPRLLTFDPQQAPEHDSWAGSDGSLHGPTTRPRHGFLLQGLRLREADPLRLPGSWTPAFGKRSDFRF